MINNEDIIFPYYSGNIRFSKVQGFVNLQQFINSHKNPTEKTLKVLSKVKIANDLNLNKLKRRLKHQLYSFTPSVYIRKHNKRNYNNVIYYTGLIQLDFDKIEDKETALDLKNYLFETYKEMICVYFSPSGLGIKCLMKINQPESKEHYKAIHKSITKEFESISYYDEATKNAMLPLFLSYDSNILYRNYNECEIWNKADWSKPNYVSLNNEKQINKYNQNKDYDYKKTCRIFVTKINSIVDNGHTQLRSACLILGSRAAAGYINLSECLNLAKLLIDQNNYLQKDLNNYHKTAQWAINEGFKTPKYY